MTEERCFFADLGGCEGQLVRAHIIPKQTIRKRYPKGAIYEDGYWWALARYYDGRIDEEPILRTLEEMQEDPRCWTAMCGGLVGIGGHHGLFDSLRLTIPREQLPEGVEEYARETGLEWYLDRAYGSAEAVA